MSEQQPSNTGAHEANTSEQLSTPHADEGEEQQGGDNRSCGNFAADNYSTSSGGFGSSVNIYSAAAGRGNFDPAAAGTFDTYNVEDEGGIRDLKRVEQVSQVRSTIQIGSIYKDGVTNNEEEIQDALQAGLPRREIEQQFDVPVDRRGKQETEPKDFVDI